ncbi:MAG: hemolysin family protein [Erysipelotrichaceae bacterium]|nr:hemolysin family protein [Erysipelotrichaceae bacterium]
MCDIVYASVNQLRLKKTIKEKHSKAAKIALDFAINYDEMLTTALFMNNLVNIAASSLSAVLAIQLFKNTLGVEVGTTIMSSILLLALLIFGEIMPKVIGRAFSYRLSLLLAYPLLVLKFAFFPIVFVSKYIGKFFAYPFIHKKKEEAISSEELQEMVETIKDEGVIDKDQSELLTNAITFKDTEAREIMTPRVEMYSLDIDDDINSLVKDDEFFTHSRIPVYKDTIDNIIGILPIKSVLRKLLANEEIDVSSLLSPVYSVPGSMGISEILDEMQKNKNHIVIVKDEYGGTDGLLTMEDILEELVGDMWDEMDEVKENYRKVTKFSYEVDGSMNIDDLFKLFNLTPPDDESYETLAGYVMDKLGRFAEVGDKFTSDNLYFEVLSIEEFTVDKVLVRKKRKSK